jgi:ATP-binding cassette subfamily B protein
MTSVSEVRLEDVYDGSRPLRAVRAFQRGQGRRLALALVAFGFKHSPVWVIPALTANVIDAVVQHRPLQELWVLGVVMGAFIAQNLPMHLLYVRLLSGSVHAVETNLRMALCRRLQELSISYHRRTSVGVLQSKIVRDVENVVVSMWGVYDSGVAAVTTLVGAVAITAVRVPEFLPVFALAVPAAAVLFRVMRGRISSSNAQLRTGLRPESWTRLWLITLLWAA